VSDVVTVALTSTRQTPGSTLQRGLAI